MDGSVARVRLIRPEVRNAFNQQLIGELTECFRSLADDSTVRVVVLSGEGNTFCGGADINWMRASLDLSKEDNVADARCMSDMFRTIDRCPKPVVAQVHGAALGGGAGLVAVCDIAIAEGNTRFGFTETKLGILPAVISPFVLAKIGSSHARALFLSGERFTAQRALDIGLVHEIAAEKGLEHAVARVCEELLTAAPGAIAAAKQTIADVVQATYEETRALTAEIIAKQRTSAEGQEGLLAFLQRRKAEWIVD
ncbi:MAG: enoyl-CoA hydratase-related protein [Candidatus Eremiobacteraeota bacterium]|nr:enoyl-CoA hydratase-related protein [Candidatus Eremiobacteraeota bacterium]